MGLPKLDTGASRAPQTITGVNVVLDGIGHLGTAKSVTLPKIAFETRDQQVGGLTRTVDLGILQKLECDITLEEYSPIAFAAMALRKLTGLKVVLKADIVQGSKHVGLVAFVNGPIIELDDGELSAKKEVERKIKLGVNYYALQIDGTQGILVDTDNFDCVIDGNDLLSETRTNLIA